MALGKMGKALEDPEEMTMPDIPFIGYPQGGRELLTLASGDLSKRGYGREVLAWCDYRCAYCGLDMAVYESWRVASVDHVVPTNAVALDGYPATWVKNPVNTVAACRPCNDLFNRDRVADPAPPNIRGVPRTPGPDLSSTS